jgi:ADP-ribosylation factor-like protein 13B
MGRFANKRDQPAAVSEDKLFHQLGLSQFHNAKLMPCIAKPAANGNMVDDRLEQGLHWLFDQVHGDFDVLDARVREDLAVKKRENDERRDAQRARVAAWKEERERALMALHDKADASLPVAETKRTETPEEGDAIKCSQCTTATAVTKCSASKWMPVCADCTVALKSTNNQ